MDIIDINDYKPHEVVPLICPRCHHRHIHVWPVEYSEKNPKCYWKQKCSSCGCLESIIDNIINFKEKVNAR